jgi:YidC/Oxa1 family membrane protein insertase
LGAIGGLYNSVYQGLGEIMKPLLLELHTLLGMAGIANWGLTIIVFTLLVKLIFWPLTVQQIRASRAMQDLQPKLNDLKKMYGKDREKLMQEQMRLYKENSVNPTAGCLPLLIQFPIWIGLYGALNLLKTDGLLAGGFLWIPSLAQPEPFPHALAILTAASQWVVQRMMATQTSDPQQKQMQQMMQFMPLMYLFFSFNVSAGLVLYWVVSNAFTMIQQSFYTGWDSIFFWRTAPAAATAGRSRRAQAVVTPAADEGGRTIAPTGTPNGVVATEPAPVSSNPAPNGTAAPRRAKKRRK